MARKRFTTEQIIAMLREAEVRIAQGEKAGVIAVRLASRDTKLLPLAPRVRWAEA